MRLKPDINIPAFMQAVQTCHGEVNYFTPEGDRINLKSTLMRFIFVAVFADKTQNLNGQIEIQNPQDKNRLQDYLI